MRRSRRMSSRSPCMPSSPVWPDSGYPGVMEPKDEGPGFCNLPDQQSHQCPTLHTGFPLLQAQEHPVPRLSQDIIAKMKGTFMEWDHKRKRKPKSQESQAAKKGMQYQAVTFIVGVALGPDTSTLNYAPHAESASLHAAPLAWSHFHPCTTQIPPGAIPPQQLTRSDATCPVSFRKPTKSYLVSTICQKRQMSSCCPCFKTVPGFKGNRLILGQCNITFVEVGNGMQFKPFCDAQRASRSPRTT